MDWPVETTSAAILMEMERAVSYIRKDKRLRGKKINKRSNHQGVDTYESGNNQEISQDYLLSLLLKPQTSYGKFYVERENYSPPQVASISSKVNEVEPHILVTRTK